MTQPPRNVAEIPGYVYDEERGRYFAVTNGESRFNKRYTNSAVQADNRQKRNDEVRKKRRVGKHTHFLLENNYLENFHYTDSFMDLSRRLGVVLFSYVPMLASLFQTEPKRLPDYLVWPKAPKRSQRRDLNNDTREVLYFNKLDGSIGLTSFPVGEKPMTPRSTSRTIGRDLLHVKNDSCEFVFYIKNPYLVQAVPAAGQTVSFSIRDFENLGLIDANTPDPDEGSGAEFEFKTTINCIAASNTSLYIFSSAWCMKTELESLTNSERKSETFLIPQYHGNILDVIVEDDLMSFFRYKELCVIRGKSMISWELGSPIRRHFRFQLDYGSLKFIVVTSTMIEMRTFSLNGPKWENDITSIPLQEHNNGAPICCLHKGILLVEEDQGNFLAVDIAQKRSERFKAPKIANIERHGNFRTIFDDQGSMYLSSSCETYVFG